MELIRQYQVVIIIENETNNANDDDVKITEN